MTEEKKPTEKTLEMRVAAIEDILAKRQITEEEMKTYEKVSNLLYGPSNHCHYSQPDPTYNGAPPYGPSNHCHYSQAHPTYNGAPLCGAGGGSIGPCFCAARFVMSVFARPVCPPAEAASGGRFGARVLWVPNSRSGALRSLAFDVRSIFRQTWRRVLCST